MGAEPFAMDRLLPCLFPLSPQSRQVKLKASVGEARVRAQSVTYSKDNLRDEHHSNLFSVVYNPIHNDPDSHVRQEVFCE